MIYGRDGESWDQLTDAGLAFLIERARLGKLTSYTELNAILQRRTGLTGFDFGRADERAARARAIAAAQVAVANGYRNARPGQGWKVTRAQWPGRR
jgi:hypothetical protein